MRTGIGEIGVTLGWRPAVVERVRVGRSPNASVAPRPNERILDVGCGDGILTKKIPDAGSSVKVLEGLGKSETLLVVYEARRICSCPDRCGSSQWLASIGREMRNTSH